MRVLWCPAMGKRSIDVNSMSGRVWEVFHEEGELAVRLLVVPWGPIMMLD